MGDGQEYKRIMLGLGALLTTTLLWGSSFPAIKIAVGVIDEYGYVGFRSIIAVLGLLPYTLYYHWRRGFEKNLMLGGLVIGTTYAIGLWLQGWGMKYTSASNAAFITGLSVVFVHVYSGLVLKRYTLLTFSSLVSALTGLYFLTNPSVYGLNIGDLLVLAGAFAWAAYIVLVDKYSGYNPLILVFYSMIPATLYIIPFTLNTGTSGWGSLIVVLPFLVYLALVCSDTATALQVYGQRFIRVEAAAIIYLLEPVFASILAYMFLAETMEPTQILGASLILLAIFLATINDMRGKDSRLH